MNKVLLMACCLFVITNCIPAQEANEKVKEEFDRLINDTYPTDGITYDEMLGDSLRIYRDVTFNDEQKKILNDPKYSNCVKELSLVSSSFTKLSYKDLAFIKNQKNFKSFIAFTKTNLDSSVLDYFDKLKMERITLHFISLNAKDLKKIAECKNLTFLGLSNNGISGKDLAFIKNLNKLDDVGFEANAVDDTIVQNLDGKDLKSINASENRKITIKFAEDRIKQMRAMGLKGNKSRTIYVINTQITRQQLKRLKYDDLNLHFIVTEHESEAELDDVYYD